MSISCNNIFGFKIWIEKWSDHLTVCILAYIADKIAKEIADVEDRRAFDKEERTTG